MLISYGLDIHSPLFVFNVVSSLVFSLVIKRAALQIENKLNCCFKA